MHKFLPFILLCFGLVCQDAIAQTTSCAQTLRLARSTYEQGRLHELPDLLKGCLNNGFTQQEKVEAYKFLTLSYIYLEEPEKADEAMLKLLQTDHYFKINPAVDPAEFVALYKTFRTQPIYRFGGNLGMLAAQPNVTSSTEAIDGTSEYKRGYSFLIGLNGEIPLNEKWTLNPGIYYLSNSFSLTSSVTTSTGDFITTANQKMNYISIPVTIQYQVMKNKLNPYVTMGVSTDYLLSATVQAERKRPGFQPIETTTFTVTPQREKLNFSGVAGIGIKTSIAGGFAIAEVRYRYGFTNVNSKSSTFDNSDLVFNYHYVDSIFKLQATSFTLGYVYNIFNPKKRNR